MTALDAALGRLAPLSPARQLRAAARHLRGGDEPLLCDLGRGVEGEPDPARLDGRLLEALCERALGGARGAVFTGEAEARLLAAFGLAQAAARRGVPAVAALAALLGEEEPRAGLRAALDGVVVLDPCCGGGALLAAAQLLAARIGARLRLLGLDVAPLAVQAAGARLALLGAGARVRAADALSARWPAADLLLTNPPFLRHEALPPAQKEAACRRSGLSRQADLAAHLAALALRHAPVAALVLPRGLTTARSAEPLLAEARARGGFALWLTSRAAGSFAASVDTALAVWVAGGAPAPPAEARVALSALGPAELLGLAGGRSTSRLRLRPEPAAAPRGAGRVGDLCQVRFGMKSGCNAFFHLQPLGEGRYLSPLGGEVALAPGDVAPVLRSLKEAAAPRMISPAQVLFRPGGPPGPEARAYVRRGEALGVSRRPTCAGRSPWWLVARGREPAPVLYPAKIGARAFAVWNDGGIWEDKKWHALFPRAVPPELLAAVLCATPVRLAIDGGARQLTGAQAIADVDCRVLSAAACPAPAALPPLAADLGQAFAALAREPVSTDLAAMLERPAQRALDEVVGRALGLGARALAGQRRALLDRLAARLAKAHDIRGRMACRGGRG
ncbi:MAG: methyltransferase [Deltaproteobacteria bacterium]|nr:methyltransferase [Deltaproteobacteria bacterium]